MATPENTPEELAQAAAALGQCPGEANPPQLPLARGERACSIRQAAFAPRETVDAAHSLGRVCGLPTVAHGGLPAGHPHCRFGGAHHPRGPGAVRLLRHRAGRGAGLEFPVGPEIEKTPERRWGLPGVFFLYPRKALGPSGSFFPISSHHWERLAAAPFSHAVFIPAGSGLTVQEPGGFRCPRRRWGGKFSQKNCCSPGRSRWRNRSRCRRNCYPGKKRSPPHWKSCPRRAWRARRAPRWRSCRPAWRVSPRPGPRAAPPWAAAAPAGAHTW